jgi:cytochrome c oxidase assembly factor CtaG
MRRVSLSLGVAIALGSALAPLDGRFSTHMLQHLLLGDLGPLLVVLGLGRQVLRPLTHPIAALSLWAAVLVAWHLTPLYDGALRHGELHVLQHVSFFLAGLLVWAALMLPGPPWFTSARKLPYLLAVWLVSLTLSQVFLWSGHSYYEGYTLNDQRAGGGVMLVEGSVVMLGVMVWLLLRIFAESEERQRELEQAGA